MSIEVEQKFHIDDVQALVGKLTELGAARTGSLDQQDIYLMHPSRDLASSDEAFRIRSDSTGTLICYKGPRKPGVVKTREEIEIPIPDGRLDCLLRMLAQLGFQERATVQKHRESWTIPQPGSLTGPITVALDSVDLVGEFAEVELVVQDHLAEEAGNRVFAAATELGLHREERRSYITMLLQRMATTAT